MIKALKIRLYPNKEQEQKFYQTSGATKFIYNWALNRWNEMYDKYKEDKTQPKPSGYSISKELTQLKKDENYKWLKQMSSKTLETTVLDLDKAFQSYFKGISKRPKFKGKKYNRISFATNYQSIKFENHKVSIEKIGKVKYKTKHNIPDAKYSNPRISFDGKHWYLTFGIEFEENQNENKNDLSIGIDLGVKDLAICSNGMVVKNINKTKEIKRLKKKLKRLQRQVSRKYEMNKDGNKFVKTNNIKKLEKQIKLVHRRLNNIRDNHIHQHTAKIIKENPNKIVMEDLNIKGMIKNKHLAKAIQEQKMYDFKRIMEYKCKFNNIEFVQVSRFYPSSKTCSNCGSIKKDLKLKDRVYKCDNCGIEIDRDFNASVNLSRYKVS